MYRELLDFVNGDSKKRHEIGSKFDSALFKIVKKFPQMDKGIKPYCGYSMWAKNNEKYEDFYMCMRYAKYSKEKASICIYIEKNERKKASFYVCLSIRPEALEIESEKEKYYRFFDLPLDPAQGLQYVVKYNAPHKNFFNGIFHETDVKGISDQASAEAFIEQEKTNSTVKDNQKANCMIELCKIITDENGDKTEEQFDQEIKDAVNTLVPYYEAVLGISEFPKETKVEDPAENAKAEDTGSEEITEVSTPENTSKITLNYPHNLILYGPPGTGKTYKTAIYAVAICEEQNDMEAVLENGYESIMAGYRDLKKSGRIGFTTFHQSFGYEDFIEGIRPVLKRKQKEADLTSEAELKKENQNLEYKIKKGVFYKFCEKARGKKEPYVFIIDELNRGNISRIFGELMTLIEESKREGKPGAVSAILPYSRKEFSVPENVYIIGTMNTADRSIAMLDTALRRRFSFEEIMPRPQKLKEMGADKVSYLDQEGNPKEINIVKMLEAINNRIEVLYDRDHTIGQAYFAELCGESATVENLQKIFKNSVFPLLQEYFFDDYYKIHLILGDNIKEPEQQFVKEQKLAGNFLSEEEKAKGEYFQDPFMGFYDRDRIEFSETRYVVNQEAFSNPESYIHIYEK